MSAGPGWAYSRNFLKTQLEDTFCRFYTPKEGDCVVDIGAGLGEETLIFALLVQKAGLVYALEANPATFSGLQYAVQQNNFSWVEPLNAAIFNENGQVLIEDNIESYLGNTINKKASPNSVPVKAITFDSLVHTYHIEKIDFLKVNIEGAEQFLIQGMDTSIDKIKNLCISCHDFRHVHHKDGEFYITKNLVVEFLKARGFTISTRNTGNAMIDDLVYAKRN